jgi:hypothetical protein
MRTSCEIRTPHLVPKWCFLCTLPCEMRTPHLVPKWCFLCTLPCEMRAPLKWNLWLWILQNEDSLWNKDTSSCPKMSFSMQIALWNEGTSELGTILARRPKDVLISQVSLYVRCCIGRSKIQVSCVIHIIRTDRDKKITAIILLARTLR